MTFDVTRIFRRALWVTWLGAALVLAGAANAESPNPVVQVKVKGSVSDALAHLKKAVSGNGMMVMGELHQGKVLSMTGLKLQSETVFVGSPHVGKQLFSANPGVGVVVPIRINVFENATGQTIVSYVQPSYLLDTFGNDQVSQVAKMLDEKLHKMVEMLAS